MTISSAEAIAKARDFAEKTGWFTRRSRLKEDASLVPAAWKVQLKGEYDDVTIEVNADSGEVLKSYSSREASLALHHFLEERSKRLDKHLAKKGYMNATEAEEIWQVALYELKGQLTKANYRTWLEKTAGLSYHNNQFAVGVPNNFVAEYLGKNQRSLIEKILAVLTGRDIEVGFTSK